MRAFSSFALAAVLLALVSLSLSATPALACAGLGLNTCGQCRPSLFGNDAACMWCGSSRAEDAAGTCVEKVWSGATEADCPEGYNFITNGEESTHQNYTTYEYCPGDGPLHIDVGGLATIFIVIIIIGSIGGCCVCAVIIYCVCKGGKACCCKGSTPTVTPVVYVPGGGPAGGVGIAMTSPQYAQPQYAQSPQQQQMYAKPQQPVAYGQPAYAQPAYGQPAYGQPAYGQAQPQQPQLYAQPAPAYNPGQPAYGVQQQQQQQQQEQQQQQVQMQAVGGQPQVYGAQPQYGAPPAFNPHTTQAGPGR